MKFLSFSLGKILKKIPYKQILFFGVLCASTYALAQGTPASEPQNDSDVIRAIVQILNLVFTLITFLLTPAIILAGWLLSPDWTMGDFFGLRPYFINVWVLVSNLVYIIFALMLLWMAVMQIFSSESNYAFKKKLPRFLVGIMIVPFTWLIVSWTLSFSNQAVAAVLSIPSGAIGGGLESAMGGGSKDKGLFHQRTIPTKFEIDFGGDAPGTPSCQSDGFTQGGESGGVKCISPAEFIAFNESGPFFIIMVYAYDIFKIQNTEAINFEAVCAGGADVKACVNSIGKLLRKFGVALITTVFFAVILIALCWVLLARAFKLWIYVMFSPLFGLAYAVSDEGLGKTLESSGGGGGDSGGAALGKVGFIPFFQLAMVPVLVSAVLSFGLLFIGVMNQTFTTGALAPTSSGSLCTKGDFMVKYCIEDDQAGGYSSRIIIGNDSSPAGDYSITFEFGSMISDMVGNSAGKTVVGAAGGLAEVGTDIFAHIILSIIAIAVMWMGVKAAVSYDEVTQKAFAPFAKFGDSVGNMVQNIPSYLPTPHPAMAALTPGGVSAMAGGINKNVTDRINYKDQKTTADILGNNETAEIKSLAENTKSVDGLSKYIDKLGGMQRGNKDSVASYESLKKTMENAKTNGSLNSADIAAFDKLTKAIQEAGSMENARTILNNSENRDTITSMQDSQEKRLLQTVQQQGGTAAPLQPRVGTIGRINQGGGGTTSVVGSNSTPLITLDNNNRVTYMDSSIKRRIWDAAVGTGTLTSDKAKEFFGDGVNFTNDQLKAIVTAAKSQQP